MVCYDKSLNVYIDHKPYILSTENACSVNRNIMGERLCVMITAVWIHIYTKAGEDRGK